MNLFYLNLKLMDLAKRTNVLGYYRFLKKTLTWDQEKIIEYQFQKCKKLLEHASENIPYYRELFEKINFEVHSFKSLEDLKKIPPLERTDIQNNLDKLVLKKRNKNRFSSSGSTGVPIYYYKDKKSISAGTAAGYFSYFLSGWDIGDKGFHIWGNESSIKRWSTLQSKLKCFFLRQTNIPSTLFNEDKNMEDIIALVNKKMPKSVDGYTSSIYNLALFLKNNDILDHKPKYVFTTAENLMEYQRVLIEQNIAGISDIYGCGEINGIAVQPQDSDRYYIIDPHVLVETETVMKDLNDIIVTDLDNKIMPLIRYKVGDQIDNVFAGDNSDKIRFNYFKKIYGRTSESITLKNGVRISPINMIGGTLLRDIGGVIKHKVIWNGEFLSLLLETSEDFQIGLANRILNEKFKKYNIELKIKIVKKLISDKNGKFKFFEEIRI